MRREAVLTQAEGLKGQNFSRQSVAQQSIMIDGTAYFMGVALYPSDIITKILIVVSTAGSAVTLSKVGLYDKLGNRLAISADQGTAWQSTGLKEVSLTSPYTVLTQDAYYIAVVSKASTTLPTLPRNGVVGQLAAAATGGIQPFGTLAGQTDLPTTAAIGTASALAYWVGWS